MSDTDQERAENERVERLARERTPGPWRIQPRFPKDRTSPYEILNTAGDQSPAIVLALAHQGWTHSGEANARLIAAAPDLLAAVENALGCIESLPESVYGVDIEELATELRSAITKATGGA